MASDRKSSWATRPYGIGQLRDGLERFTFLLGGSDGKQLSGP